MVYASWSTRTAAAGSVIVGASGAGVTRSSSGFRARRERFFPVGGRLPRARPPAARSIQRITRGPPGGWSGRTSFGAATGDLGSTEKVPTGRRGREETAGERRPDVDV